MNLDSQQFYKISKVLLNAYIVPENTEDNLFYLNNNGNWDQYNQLYDIE